MHFYKASTSPFLKGTSSCNMCPWLNICVQHNFCICPWLKICVQHNINICPWLNVFSIIVICVPGWIYVFNIILIFVPGWICVLNIIFVFVPGWIYVFNIILIFVHGWIYVFKHNICLWLNICVQHNFIKEHFSKNNTIFPALAFGIFLKRHVVKLDGMYV